MKNIKKGLLHLAIILAVMALFAVTVIVGLGRHHKGSAENILLGLDPVSYTHLDVYKRQQRRLS